jgi:putative ABC transport system ATP-binding protein
LGLPVRLIDVTHRYGNSADEGTGTIALRNVTLEIDSGAFLAIMGASGSGKSTLLHLVGAIDRPTEGQVLLGDRNIARLPDSELTLVRRQSIGFVFQFFNLVPTLTAKENVRFPLDLSGAACNRNEAARAMLDRVGLAHRLDRYPSELSGGEMQRVAIARAIVHRPPILLADEPTGNLDSRTGETILELLRDVHAESGMTMLIATHSHHAATFAQGTLTIADGCLQGVEAVR